MTIQTFDEWLQKLCDEYDSYIQARFQKPYKILRSNLNNIYLYFKAIAKGLETMSNTAQLLNFKFDPLNCDPADLPSVAKITGTYPRTGKGSGLIIAVTNTGTSSHTLYGGDYVYRYSDDAVFEFTVDHDEILAASASITFGAVTQAKGAWQVSDISSIEVSRVDLNDINEDFLFSCFENSDLLGFNDETPEEFRKRLLSDADRQNTIKELEEELKRLPYILDCNCTFNATGDTVVIDGISVPQGHLLLALNGNIKPEVAEIVAKHGIYPTAVVDPAKVIYFYNDIFFEGKYAVYYTNFQYLEYTVELDYTYDQTLVSDDIIQATVNLALLKYRSPSSYVAQITEDIFYNAVNDLHIPSMKLLSVTISVSGSPVAYVSVPRTRLGKLTNITYDGTIA